MPCRELCYNGVQTAPNEGPGPGIPADNTTARHGDRPWRACLFSGSTTHCLPARTLLTFDLATLPDDADTLEGLSCIGKLQAVMVRKEAKP